jgi:hypothetical protein
LLVPRRRPVPLAGHDAELHTVWLFGESEWLEGVW